MCGILAIFAKDDGGTTTAAGVVNNDVFKKKRSFKIPAISKSNDNPLLVKSIRELAYEQSKKQRHRGPDHTGICECIADGVVIVQERLAVLCVETGDQPLTSINDDDHDQDLIILAANGEIYNYLELSAEIAEEAAKNNNKSSGNCQKKYTPRSDCDVILGIYEQFGEQYLFERITGMFSFVLYDSRKKHLLIGRDPIGIIPLYKGEDVYGNLWIASEMKCLVNVCEKITVFPPGTYLSGTHQQLRETPYYQPTWIREIPTMRADLMGLRQKLESAVRSHLQCDVKFGALLSGGIDSSLIASIATRIMREKQPDFRLKTYSIGLMTNAPDFKYSQMVSEYIGSDHRNIVFQISDGLDSIRDIIYHTESYDIATVRCSIPMLLLARAIKADGLKMILSGEGSDEIFGGYLYLFQAPNAMAFHEETVKLVLNLHYSDCLRANKSTCAWGLELRVPFLDTAFIDYAMSIRPNDRMPGVLNEFVANEINGHNENGLVGQQISRMEKYILRAAFNNVGAEHVYLPDEVLWRQKEQLSDGVGYSFIDTLREYVSERVPDELFAKANEFYPINTPVTKEAFYYRTIFTELFPGKECAQTVTNWIPRKDWGCPEDPSGRAQQVHNLNCS